MKMAHAFPIRYWLFLVMVPGILSVTACAHQPPAAGCSAPGFFSGLLHGFLILFSLVGSLFTEIRIYAYPNAGFFYDLGYVIGALAFLGGAGTGTKKAF
jgi:hypothetical protein